LIVILWIYFLNAYNFLSVSKPVKPDLLVVEGWLQRDGLFQAKEEFLHHNYKFILTTGFPNSDGYLMGSNGRLVFETIDKIATSKDSTYKITFTVRGTKANKKYPHFNLFADSSKIGDGFTSHSKKAFSYEIKLANPPDSVMLEFDNDLFTNFNDRNMFIYSISVNNMIFKADNDKVICYSRKNGQYYFYQRLSPNSAQDAANYLKSLGIPDSLIVPVVTTHKLRSRTFASAVEVKNWLNLQMKVRCSLTVFSQGPHARRTFTLYKKAFGTSADIGIISGKIKEFNSTNWWRCLGGWKSVLYETAGLIYVSLVL
jgi:uncharacterized protein (DUF736 family)